MTNNVNDKDSEITKMILKLKGVAATGHAMA